MSKVFYLLVEGKAPDGSFRLVKFPVCPNEYGEILETCPHCGEEQDITAALWSIVYPFPDQTKCCNICNRILPLTEEFFLKKRAREEFCRYCKDCMRARSRKRRALKAQATGSFSENDVRRQYESQNGKCWWCGKLVGDTYHVDHRVPLSRGGSDDATNIVIACPHCNMSKGAKMPHEWIGRLL